MLVEMREKYGQYRTSDQLIALIIFLLILPAGASAMQCTAQDGAQGPLVNAAKTSCHWSTDVERWPRSQLCHILLRGQERRWKENSGTVACQRWVLYDEELVTVSLVPFLQFPHPASSALIDRLAGQSRLYFCSLPLFCVLQHRLLRKALRTSVRGETNSRLGSQMF